MIERLIGQKPALVACFLRGVRGPGSILTPRSMNFLGESMRGKGFESTFLVEGK